MKTATSKTEPSPSTQLRKVVFGGSLLSVVAILAILVCGVYGSDAPLTDPAGYVLQKLERYDLVMIGEHHWFKEEPAFIREVVKRCYEKHVIDFLFLEFGNFAHQKNVEAFLQAKEYEPTPVIDMLKESTDMGWGYQEYLDIFRMVYFENRARPTNERIRIVLVDGPPSTLTLNMDSLHECLDGSPLSASAKWEKVTWLREGIAGRDPFMAEVIAMHLFDKTGQKGIYYAGSSHIRKDLRKKDFGLRLFSAGGILCSKYPGRICAMTFHNGEQYWRKPSGFSFFESLYEQHPKGFGIDTTDPRASHFTLESDIVKNGVPLDQAFDGYIVLNRYHDYHPCSLIPGFYDDGFAQVVWTRLRKEGDLDRLPAELAEFKSRPWSGEELRDLINRGFH